MSNLTSRVQQRIEELKSLIKAHTPAMQHESLPVSVFPQGIPQAGVTEISGELGMGKTEAVLQLLVENPLKKVAWIEDQMTVYPPAFAQRGIQLSRLLFVEGGMDVLWTTLQVLKSGLFEVVVISVQGLNFNETDLRRLQLASEKAGSAVILLTERPSPQHLSWPFSLQLEVKRNLENKSSFDFNILRSRRALVSQESQTKSDDGDFAHEDTKFGAQELCLAT